MSGINDGKRYGTKGEWLVSTHESLYRSWFWGSVLGMEPGTILGAEVGSI